MRVAYVSRSKHGEELVELLPLRAHIGYRLMTKVGHPRWSGRLGRYLTGLGERLDRRHGWVADWLKPGMS